jgi:hypothetical protein
MKWIENSWLVEMNHFFILKITWELKIRKKVRFSAKIFALSIVSKKLRWYHGETRPFVYHLFYWKGD